MALLQLDAVGWVTLSELKLATPKLMHSYSNAAQQLSVNPELRKDWTDAQKAFYED